MKIRTDMPVYPPARMRDPELAVEFNRCIKRRLLPDQQIWISELMVACGAVLGGYMEGLPTREAKVEKVEEFCATLRKKVLGT